MELAKRIILQIASASQRVISAATEYASRRGFRNVQSSHFRLEKEMQRISVATEGMLGVLSKSSLPNGPPLDDRLQEWFSTDELPTCLDTLNQMERILQSDTWINTIFNFMNTQRSSSPENKINKVVKLFDSRKNFFHFLLTTDVWNCEEPRQQPRSRSSAHALDGLAVERVLEPNIDATKVNQAINSVPDAAAGGPTSNEGRVDDLRKLDDILQWLDGLSCAAKQEESLSLRQPDTCTWLNSTPEYESWRNNDDSSLWLQGKPGSGKTILASFVVDSLKNKRRSGETLAFFYCDFRNDRSTSAAEVMRSLLSQLLRYVRNGNIDLRELVDDLVRERDGDTPILTNVKHLATFISQTAKQFSHQPLVVVDALDECKDVEKLLDGLFILVKGGFRLFVTSRPLQIIKDSLRGLSSISIGKMAGAVLSDIALHVTRELDSRRRLRDLKLGLKMKIHSILCDRADGMFRWVQCQIDTLNQCATRAEIREALDNLPIGLDETYQRILLAIDTGSPEGRLALRALMWLVGALRPLRLPEILDGLTLDLGRRLMDPDIGPMHKGALLDACGSLVTYNEDTDILILSHFSVKEYLTGDLTRIKLPQYHISYQDTHEHLARLCICYVTLYLKHVHGSSQKDSLTRIMRTIGGRSLNATGQWSHSSENPSTVLSVSQELLGYVFTHGFHHLAYLGSSNRVVLEDMVTLQSDIQRHHDAWEVMRRVSQRYKLSTPWPGRKHDFMLYILTAFASDSLLHAFLGHNRKVLKIKYRTNPLIYAAYFGKVQHAQLLLSHGAKANESGLVVDASGQALPLEVAVSRQHDAMVDLLLSTGSIVPHWLFTFSTNNNFPIRITRRLLQTDEFVEWAAEPGNRLPSPVGLLERRPPLVYEKDIIVMIRRLVQVGLDPAARNSAQKTAIHFAIAGGYQAVVVYLLLIGTPLPFDFMSALSRTTSSERMPMFRLIVDAGADVRVSEATALHLAMKILEQNECLEAVKILVGAGCKPFLHDNAGKTPLHLALEQRYHSVADYLLSQQRSAPLDALSAVVESECPTTWRVGTVRALINDGANIHGVTAYGDGLLHQAVKSVDEHHGLEMVKFLVDAGCNPFHHNVQGKTPFHIALDRKFPLLADYLLSTGRPLPPDTLFSVLHSALPAVWKAQTIRSLVAKGADTRGFSAEGNTLLHATMLVLDERQGADVAKLLVDVGCDPFMRNNGGETPLYITLDRKFPLLADHLLSIGRPLPPDALFAIVHSALPAAWRAQTICFLVSRGADPSGLSANGSTLLHTTVLVLDEPLGLDVAKLFASVGCDPFGSDGEAPLHIALNRKFPLLADYLLSVGRPLPPDALFAILRSALPAAWRAQTIYSLVSSGADSSGLSVDGNTLLHATVLALDERLGLDVAKLLVGAGCGPLTRNVAGATPLHMALKRGYHSMADYLLSAVKLSASDALFIVLTRRCSVDWIVESLDPFINAGADMCSITPDGNSLIHAVMVSQEDACLKLLRLLVRHGCNPSSRNREGKTALHIAVNKVYVFVMEYILSLDRSIPDDILFSVLKSPSRSTLLILPILIDKGANMNAMMDGDTLLHIAISSFRDGCLSNERFVPELIVKTLVDGGCDTFASNSCGKTPLHLAVAEGYVTIVKYLLSITTLPYLPADILVCALDGKAARANWKDTHGVLQLLIRKGANVHVRAAEGGSLLHVVFKKYQCPLQMLPRGPNTRPSTLMPPLSPLSPSFTSISGDAAPWIDIDDSHNSRLPSDTTQPDRRIPQPAMPEEDDNTGRPLYPSYTYPGLGSLLGIIRILVDSGCDPSQCDADGHPPVYYAVLGGHVDLVRYLLRRTVPLPQDLLGAVDLAPRYARHELRGVLARWESPV